MKKFRLFLLTSLVVGFSMSFTSCSKDDDDDDNNNPEKEQTDGQDKNTEEKTEINAQLIGSWRINEAACKEDVYFNGHSLEGEDEEYEDEDDDSTGTYILGGEATLNADGTLLRDGVAGEFECYTNDQVALSVEWKGVRTTLKKGSDAMALLKSAMGTLGYDDMPITVKSSSIDNCAATVKDGKLNVDMTLSAVLDMSQLAEKTDFESQLMLMIFSSFCDDLSNFPMKMVITDVYDRVE